MSIARVLATFVVVAAACGGSDEDSPNPPPGPATCPQTAGPGGAAIFDGIDGHATTGVKPELGLAIFTIEAWVRRDGDGSTVTSGNGGLRLAPIASKGLGEGDGSNVDTNYMFGFWGDVLGADFEDMATGANHPVTGTRAIPRGEWHHVAASYDGATWRLYLDGSLDGEATVNATPRSDSIHAFAIGSAIGSDGVARGFLHGAVDEVRVWSVARSGDEIADGMYRTIAMAEGLRARWSFDAGGADPSIAADSAGAAPATLVAGAQLIADAVTLDQGAAPRVAATSPSDGMTTGPSVELDIALELASRTPVDVTYHLRELSAADDFTIVVLPDTQNYTREGANLERYFHDQTQWVRDHRADYNIVGVIHNGDIINNEPQIYQWNVADAAMARLEVPEADLPDGVPYGVAVGNHDNKLVGTNTVSDTARFNEYFGVSRFAGRSYYGGHRGSTNDDSWVTFSAGGLDFVVVNLMYELEPDPAAVAWARSIFQMHPEAFGILNTHFLLTGGGNFSPQARLIYDELRDLPNVHLMTGGHISAENRRVDVHEGRTIHSMLADYQSRADGGSGFMRIWEFSPASQTVSVKSYSPTLDKFETDDNSEFTLEVDLRGAGGPFRAIQVTGAEPDSVATTLELEVGKTYEWYAEVSSCGKRVTTPLSRFTTVASAAAAKQIQDTFQQPPRTHRTQRVTSGPVHVGPDDPALAD